MSATDLQAPKGITWLPGDCKSFGSKLNIFMSKEEKIYLKMCLHELMYHDLHLQTQVLGGNSYWSGMCGTQGPLRHLPQLLIHCQHLLSALAT